MIRFYDYFKQEYRHAMYSLNYNKHNSVSGIDYELIVTDSFTIEKKADELVVFYSRNLVFEPSGVFDLNLTYKLIFDPANNNDWRALSEQEIIEALCADASYSLSEVAARMSLVIGEVMLNGNHEPIILPPIVIKEKQE